MKGPLEERIVDIVNTKLTDGTLERLIEKNFEELLKNTTSDLFRPYGAVGREIERKVKSVVTPAIESNDYSQYIIRLDDVVAGVIEETTKQNRAILENFQQLISPVKFMQEVKTSEIFEKWCDFAAREVDTSKLEINTDDDVSYQNIEVSMCVEVDESRSWSMYERATLTLSCEEDEDLKHVLELSRWKSSDKGIWELDRKSTKDMGSIRHMSKFEAWATGLSHAHAQVVIDCSNDEAELEVYAVPEPDWS